MGKKIAETKISASGMIGRKNNTIHAHTSLPLKDSGGNTTPGRRMGRKNQTADATMACQEKAAKTGKGAGRVAGWKKI